MHPMSRLTALTVTQHLSKYGGLSKGPFFLMKFVHWSTKFSFCSLVHDPSAATGSSEIIAHTSRKRNAIFPANMVLIGYGIDPICPNR